MAAAVAVMAAEVAEVAVIIITNRTSLFLQFLPTVIAAFACSNSGGNGGGGSGHGGGDGGGGARGGAAAPGGASTVSMIRNTPLHQVGFLSHKATFFGTARAAFYGNLCKIIPFILFFHMYFVCYG